MAIATFDVRDFGADGSLTQDASPFVAAAFAAALQQPCACVHFPAGEYLLTTPPDYTGLTSRIAITGDGANVSLLYFQSSAGLSFQFEMSGWQQPHGLTLRDIGLHALGPCARALKVSYGTPPVINDHNQPSVSVRGVQIISGRDGTWDNGVQFENCWNPTLENVFISGDSCGGNWNALRGSGVELVGSCINAHLSNVHGNFFAEFLRAHAGEGKNTEGIFVSNCSAVGVKRGAWIVGNPDYQIGDKPVPRISTLTWTGGLIELRAAYAGIHVDRVWTSLINSVQILTDGESDSVLTFGVLAENSDGVVVNGCDLNAVMRGVLTTGTCRAIGVIGNTFTNTDEHVVFTQGTTRSKVANNVVTDKAFVGYDLDGSNSIS